MYILVGVFNGDWWCTFSQLSKWLHADQLCGSILTASTVYRSWTEVSQKTMGPMWLQPYLSVWCVSSVKVLQQLAINRALPNQGFILLVMNCFVDGASEHWGNPMVAYLKLQNACTGPLSLISLIVTSQAVHRTGLKRSRTLCLCGISVWAAERYKDEVFFLKISSCNASNKQVGFVALVVSLRSYSIVDEVSLKFMIRRLLNGLTESSDSTNM